MSVMFSSVMFLRETYRVDPQRIHEFERVYQGRYGPLLAARGFRRVGLWRSSLLQGCGSEFMALWEFDRSEQMMQLSIALDALKQCDPAFVAVRNAVSELSSTREGWTLLGVGATLTLAQIQSQGMALETCLYEDIEVAPNQYVLFDKGLRVNYLRLLEGTGIELVGVFRPQLKTKQAVALWNLRDGYASLSHLDRLEQLPEWRHWHNVAQTFRSAWRGRLFHRTR